MSIYLIAQYSIRPQRNVKTQQAGWMSNPNNVSYDESIAIARKLKPRDHQTSKIILDFTDRKVVKNTWNDGKSFDELFSYFYQGYPNYINPILKELGYSVETTDRSAQEAEVAQVQPAGTSISSS
jgi:hypothetical protein